MISESRIKLILLLFGLIIVCISPAYALFYYNLNYVGLDKVDLSWSAISVEGFDRYEIRRDGEVVHTIYDRNVTQYRDSGLNTGSYSYEMRWYSEDDWDFSTIKTARVGYPSGTLTCGDDTWDDSSVFLGGNVNLGGHTLEITSPFVFTDGGVIRTIGGTGGLEIRDSTFEDVKIDVTAPDATLRTLESDQPITVRGGGISASGVVIPRDESVDATLTLYGNGNHVEECNAWVSLYGSDGIIEKCQGQWAKIEVSGFGDAPGNNNTIRNNVLQDVLGWSIYANANNNLFIWSNEIINASTWDKSYYDTYYGTGIYLRNCEHDIELYNNTIDNAQEQAIYSILDSDKVLENLAIEYNIITNSRKYGFMGRGLGSGWMITNNYFDSCPNWLFYNVGTLSYVTIKSNELRNVSGSLYFTGNHSSILDNTFNVLDSEALRIHGDNLLISGNLINGTYHADNQPEGIEVSASNSVVKENIIQNCFNGMSINDIQGDNLTVRHNEFYDLFGDWGIYCHDVYSFAIEDNTFINASRNAEYGVIFLQYCGNVTIKDNVIEESPRTNGIHISRADDGIEIVNNTIKGSERTSIRINMAKNGDSEKNYQGKADVSVVRNTINGTSFGLVCNYVDNVTFQENVVTNGITRGIHIQQSDMATVEGNRVLDIPEGIYIYKSDQSVVNANIFNVTRKGGQFTNPISNLTVAGNYFSGYSTTGVEIRECTETTFSNNVLKGAGGSDIYLQIPTDTLQDTLLLEKNTVGNNHPTTFTLEDIDNPIFIRAVETPPDPPSPPDYDVTQSSIGKWLEIYGEYDWNEQKVNTDVDLNLTFHYTKDDVKYISEDTLSIWKYNGTGWDPGSDAWDSWNKTRWHNLGTHDIGVQVQELCIFAPLGGLPVHNARIPKDYTTIQEALDDYEFQDGDTITVDDAYSGTEENVESYRNFKLKSSSGLAEAVTLTAADPYSPALSIWGSTDVEIDGFIITGATGSQGVRMEGCENAKLTRSKVEGNFFGVVIKQHWSGDADPSTNCKITSCTITGNDNGAVYVNRSKDSVIIENTLSGAVGVGLQNSEGSFISGNTITDCKDYGIASNVGKSNEIANNAITGGGLGVYLYSGESETVKDTTITNTEDSGLLLEETKKSTFTDLTITGAPEGIRCDGADENTFTGIAISGGEAGGSNLVGISLHNSDNNRFTDCSIADLQVVGYAATGIEMYGTSYRNVFDTCTISGLMASRVDGARLTASYNEIQNSTFTDLRGAAAGASGIFSGENSTANTITECSFNTIYATQNATAFQVQGAKHLIIQDCAVGAVMPEENASYALFENSEYSNVIKRTTLGSGADIHELRVEGNLIVSNTTSIPPDEPGILNIGSYLVMKTNSTAEAWLSFNYKDGDLGGKDPAFLSLWKNGGSGWQQLPQPNNVNTTARYVYAENITEFSVFAPMWHQVQAPVANFSATPLIGVTPLAVTFTDDSQNTPTAWNWAFSRDRGVSWELFNTTHHPVHLFTEEGNYSVKLTIANAAGEDTFERIDYLRIYPQPVANFTASTTTGPAVRHVTFTDLSTGMPTSWLWNFGDGNSSTSQNPVYNYTAKGTYNVSLTVTNDGGGTDTETKIRYVTVYEKGDFNGNERVDIGDVARVAWMAAGLIEPDMAADFNGDGRVDGADASKIAYYYVGKEKVL
ncbi:right-handed parallel beta-helix repeat-containing protein [Methanocalculus taiwanensis]|nr:right-handed parallel beta-helix repeat-containing protein [Methanocalculus taiwanensis]